ncbi:cyclophilin-like domain-containing protein [Flagelloscypha sp. PMI_526]|nr:cyclophilin-like domain-containing protein [Flagelloscypha sp. PMI_526]
MGHGSDKLYVTVSEHSGKFGQHSAVCRIQNPGRCTHHRAQITPFDCCTLSFQPFEHPVCARTGNRGHVFDLVNIIPWLKQHNNTHPITKEPLQPSDLISLTYSRKEATNEIHDPISFKPFSENSSIVTIATTGNVFLYESIKGGRDLVADVPFKRQDIIVLQDPHGQIPDLPAPTPVPAATTEKTVPVPKSVVAVKTKQAEPWNVSPYSSGLPGASLTSTSVDPNTTGSSKLGKGKEKDMGKRRAYVRMVTSLGGGSLNLELFCEKTCYNFLMLARQGKYNDVIFHRLIPGFMVYQGGDPTGTGTGGSSFWGTPFRDEHDMKGAAKHDARGAQIPTGSQFYFTFKPTPHLDKKHTVFGKLVGGENVLDALEKLPRKDGTERPAKTVKITEIIMQDPFEDYKTRLAKKLARKANSDSSSQTTKKQTQADQTNWFGTKLGTPQTAASSIGAGVGRYLQQQQHQQQNLKRPLAQVASTDELENKKKRKVGFGDFAGW